ncbi:MAG TPA: metalloregulator ArsR/SmtB family transcription factor [Galbitalea sp.]
MATDELSKTFAALADPTRRAILARLANGEASVGDLAAPFAMSLPAVSKHLQVLERAGLVSRGREAQWRPAMLRADPLEHAADWIEGYRHFWESSFDQLAGHLEAIQKPATNDPNPTDTTKEENND